MQIKFQSLRSMGLVMPFWVALLVFGSMFVPVGVTLYELDGGTLPAKAKALMGIAGLISLGIWLAWHLPIWRVDPLRLADRMAERGEG